MCEPARNDMKCWVCGSAMYSTAKHMAPCGVVVVLLERARPEYFEITDWETASEYVRKIEDQASWESVSGSPRDYEDYWQLHHADRSGILD